MTRDADRRSRRRRREARRRRWERTVVGWNAKVGRGPAAIRGLARLVRDTDPGVVMLAEAKNYVWAIRARFPGWRVYARHGWSESANCPVMVRRSLPRGRRRGRGWGVVRNRIGWMHKKWHPGRTWTWARAIGIGFLAGHRATSPLNKNRKAGMEEADALVEWFDDHAGPLLAHLDHNIGINSRGSDAARGIARRVGGRVVFDPDQPGIDYAIVRDLDVTARRIGNYGSDHDAIEYTLH